MLTWLPIPNYLIVPHKPNLILIDLLTNTLTKEAVGNSQDDTAEHVNMIQSGHG